MDQEDIIRVLMTSIRSFIQDRLLNEERRAQQKEQCAERLAAEGENSDFDTEVRYADQAVLANLDWGIDALEEAIATSNTETKFARLGHAEKMLQVCAMLNSQQKTAGVPNFYLSAWAHLNLSYLCELRNDVHGSVLHVIEMFLVDPFFSRIDFAPELWKDLFLPHMSSTVGWYSEARHRLVMEVIPDAADLSFTADLDQFFNESIVFAMRPDQMEKLQKLEQVYKESLDENTRLYAKYYRDCMNSNSSNSKKAIPMFPIAEPPMTPLHEVSRSIPDYVKFGPILPKTSGFPPVMKPEDVERQASRSGNVTSKASPQAKKSILSNQDVLADENGDDSDYENHDVLAGSGDRIKKLLSLNSVRMLDDRRISTDSQPSTAKNRTPKSPSPFDSPRRTRTDSQASTAKNRTPRSPSPLDSPTRISTESQPPSAKTGTPTSPSPFHSPKIPSKASSPNANMDYEKEPTAVSRLMSVQVVDPTMPSSLPASPHLSHDYSISSIDSDSEAIMSRRTNRNMDKSQHNEKNHATYSFLNRNDDNDDNSSCASLSLSEKQTSQPKPPKDFVCPITGQIFNDPVTLETGQTYERRAIQEWLERGNATCPITRQALSATTLPKTNYVLKRLITSWKEQNPELAHEFSYCETPRNSFSPLSVKENSRAPDSFLGVDSPTERITKEHIYRRTKRFHQAPVATSPTSVISQAAIETIITCLKPYVSCLCTSEDLQECERAVLAIAKTWKDAKADPAIVSFLSKPTIINGLVEILAASLNREVLRTSIYILSELIAAEESIGETLTIVDSDFDCLSALLKNGLSEAAVLIHQLKPTYAQLSVNDFVPSLIQLILNRNEISDDFQFVMEPKDAAIAMLEQMLVGGDENSRKLNTLRVISANGILGLIKCMDKVAGRESVISILLSCIRADKSCRSLIASRIDLSLVLELIHTGNDCLRGTYIEFLSEIVQSDRRTVSNQILQIIKDEGSFSTMHTLLVHLQMATMEQRPAVATLLLQLDLLTEPRKMSIYREEAIEALIELLHKRDFTNSQMLALEALSSLSGRFISSGKSCTEAWLLKTAGFAQPYNILIKEDNPTTNEYELAETMEEEEKALSSWEKKVSFVLCNHEKGSIFKALEECLRSNSIELAKSCLVVATWLIHMLSSLPDTGMKNAARKSLLEEFINVLQSSKNLEDKILATLAIRTFVKDSAALEELGAYARCIYKNLRKLKKHSVLVTDILKALMNSSSVNATELWSCTELIEIESSMNGEVLCLLALKGRLLSGHADGTIKVWDAGKRTLRLIQEVREHTKAVSCLYLSSSGDKLYSGSLDKTIRIWAIKPEHMHCTQVHDVKEAVYALTADVNRACYVSPGTGVKVYNWSGTPKHINFNKHVKCLAMAGNKLYCGLSGYSIQEVDLRNLTSSTFYSRTRKLLGKQTVLSLHIHDGSLLAGGSSVDGAAGKVFSLSGKAVCGSFAAGNDIQHIAVSNDFIYTATKCGIIEVWLKERYTKVGSIKTRIGGQARITSLASQMDGGMLFAGSSEGKIQAWEMD